MFARPEPQLGTQRDVIPQRAAALLIDSALVAVLVGAAALLVGTGPLLIVVGAAISFGYLVFFEGTYGQTVGKHLMNLVVVSRRGYPCSYRAAALRTVLRVVDALPSFFIVGLASIFLTRRSQRLGDIAADTIVVRSMARGARMF